MSEPFLAEIRLVSFNFAPSGWALCNGQLLSINQNQALFALLGTTYGGDGRTNFALPDLRGRVPRGAGDAIILGERSGTETGVAQAVDVLTDTSLDRGLSASLSSQDFAAGDAGYSGQAVDIRPPYLCLNYIIALQGVFPSQT